MEAVSSHAASSSRLSPGEGLNDPELQFLHLQKRILMFVLPSF